MKTATFDMSLNDDCFKNLELSDDDILTDDSSLYDSDITLYDINREANAKYHNTIKISINNDVIKQHGVQILINTSKRLNQLFEYYDIQHSQMYVLSGLHDLSPNNPNRPTIIQCDDYIHIINNAHYDNTYHDYDYNTIVMFIERPRFANIKKMLRFIHSLMNILFGHQIVTVFFKNIMIYDEIREIYNERIWFNSLKLDYDEYRKTGLCIDLFIKNKTDMNIPTKWSCISFIQRLNKWFFGKWTALRFNAQWGDGNKVDFNPVINDEPYQ